MPLRMFVSSCSRCAGASGMEAWPRSAWWLRAFYLSRPGR